MPRSSEIGDVVRGDAPDRACRYFWRAATLALAALLLAAASAAGQDALRVTAYLSADSVAVGDVVVLQLAAETDGPAPEFEDPQLPTGLQIVGRSDRTDVQYSFPGGRSRTLRRDLAIRAAAPGEFRIPAIAVTAGDAVRNTSPLRLVVAGAAPVDGADTLDGGIVLQASLSADTVFVSEQLTLRTDVLIADQARTRLRGAPEYSPPATSGFWLHEMPREPARFVFRDGRRFEMQSFTRAYFPISPGEYRIPPARLIYETRDGFLASPVRHELATDTFRVVVLPIPETGRPSGFAGAVGRFEIDASVEPAEVVAGDPVALTITVSGTGNLRGLPAPALPQLRNVQTYPPTEETEVEVVDGNVHGSKRFTWIVVPEEAGPLLWPAIEYPYFDPATRTFEVAHTAPVTLAVRGSARELAASGAVVRPARQMRPGGPTLGWVRSPAFIMLQFVPLLALLWAVRRRRRDVRRPSPSRRSLRSDRVSMAERLRELATGDTTAFLDAVDSGCRRWLSGRLGESAIGSASPEEVRAILERHGVAVPAVRAMVSLLERVQHARYAPVPPGADVCQEIADEVARLLAAIDRQAAGSATSIRTPAILAAFVLAGSIAGQAMASASPAQAETSPAAQTFDESTYGDALAALEAGDGLGAARALLALIGEEPRIADVWYDLGVACHAAGEDGCATWAWLMTLRLQPRDADARHNLEAVGISLDTMRRVTPPIPISFDESLLLISMVWFIAAAALTRRILKQARGLAMTALAAGVGALLILANMAVAPLRQPAAVLLEDGATVHSAPNVRSAEVATLPAGTVLGVVDVRGRDWVRIASDTGQEGWIENASLARLAPGSVPDVVATLRERL